MENRKVKRKNVLFSLHYVREEDGAGDACRDATVMDISDRGIRFETIERLPVGTRLKLTCDHDEKPPPGHIVGEEGVVVWSIQPEPDVPLFLVGLKYA